jgi:Rho GTPase-activating protein 1
LIRIFDEVADGEYVLVYCHSNFESGNRPDYGWLKKIYRIFARKYKKNLKRLFIVHPDTWLKFFFFLAKLVRLVSSFAAPPPPARAELQFDD